MNIVRGQLSKSDGRLEVTCLGTTFAVPWPLKPRVEAGREVLVGIRPDDFGPADQARASAVRVKGLTDVCEQTGIAIYATITCEGDASVVAKLPRHPMPKANEHIEVAFDPHNVHLFDAESEASLLDRSPGAPADETGGAASTFAPAK